MLIEETPEKGFVLKGTELAFLSVNKVIPVLTGTSVDPAAVSSPDW